MPVQAAGRERLLEDRPGDELGRPGRDGRLDEHEAVLGDPLADRPEGRLQRGHVGLAAAHVPELLLGVVALHVHDHAVGELEAVAVVGRRERPLLEHAARDDGVDLGVLGLDRGDALVQQPDLPVAARAGALAADHELGRPALGVGRVRDDGGHHGADEAQAHDDDDLHAVRARLRGQALEALGTRPGSRSAAGSGICSPLGLTEYSVMTRCLPAEGRLRGGVPAGPPRVAPLSDRKGAFAPRRRPRTRSAWRSPCDRGGRRQSLCSGRRDARRIELRPRLPIRLVLPGETSLPSKLGPWRGRIFGVALAGRSSPPRYWRPL